MARRKKQNLLSRQGTPWTDSALDFLINKAGVLSTSRIALQLRRSEKAVRRKAESLGLSLRRS